MMLEKFIQSRNLEKSTINGYKIVVNQYEAFHEMKLDELILEACADEKQHSNIHQRRIYDRILNFRNYLQENGNLEVTTINYKIKKLQGLYSYYDITFPQIRNLKNNQKPLTYFDLPNKEHIQLSLESTDVQNQALILFLASSGTGKSECASITIADFINATSEYHNGGTLEEIIDELYETDEPLVPTFFLKRHKTQKEFYTFCTPEASFAILKYLKHRLKVTKQNGKDNIDLSGPLFGTTARGIGDKLSVINDNLGFGFKGKFRFFKPYALRKFFASNIGLSEEYIDMLQGRKKSSVHDAYIKPNPKYLKELYMEVMDNVTINLKKQNKKVLEEYTIHIHLHFHEI